MFSVVKDSLGIVMSTAGELAQQSIKWVDTPSLICKL